MRKNSYHSYRGRRSSGRSALAIVLVLVLAAACSVLFLQRYIIYSDDGSIRLELPFAAGEKEPPAGGKEPALSPPEMSLVVEDPAPTPPVEPEEPAGSPYGVHRLVELTQLPNDAAALAARLQEAGANGFVYRLRDNTGRVFYDSAAAVSSAAVGTVGTAEQLSTLCQAEGVVSVARFNCFHDSYYAWLNMESAGVCQSNGYIWYDNLSYHWLDPAKEQARAYVIALALECAQMGFDELLLEDVYYPTQGKLSKIDYSGSTMGKDAAIELFLNELRNALAGYDMKVHRRLRPVRRRGAAPVRRGIHGRERSLRCGNGSGRRRRGGRERSLCPRNGGHHRRGKLADPCSLTQNNFPFFPQRPRLVPRALFLFPTIPRDIF